MQQCHQLLLESAHMANIHTTCGLTATNLVLQTANLAAVPQYCIHVELQQLHSSMPCHLSSLTRQQAPGPDGHADAGGLCRLT